VRAIVPRQVNALSWPTNRQAGGDKIKRGRVIYCRVKNWTVEAFMRAQASHYQVTPALWHCGGGAGLAMIGSHRPMSVQRSSFVFRSGIFDEIGLIKSI
jgi:hypothetical protein